MTLLSVIGNSAWILGLAILLANTSIQYDEARRSQNSLLQHLETGSSVLVTWLGLCLVAAGLAATSSSTWELAIWVVVALFCLASAIRGWRNHTRLA